ncbi:hypothetical protein CPK_ORF00555 [Chlamydia pneumoniae LPCoLN]|nr:hypothetical protein CPK_ORF00555 [Chlamydia pneumoniae LPCoLN]
MVYESYIGGPSIHIVSPDSGSLPRDSMKSEGRVMRSGSV